MLKILVVDDEAVVRRGIVLGIDWAARGRRPMARRASPPWSGTAPA